jgi:hypothetical protein
MQLTNCHEKSFKVTISMENPSSSNQINDNEGSILEYALLGSGHPHRAAWVRLCPFGIKRQQRSSGIILAPNNSLYLHRSAPLSKRIKNPDFSDDEYSSTGKLGDPLHHQLADAPPNQPTPTTFTPRPAPTVRDFNGCSNPQQGRAPRMTTSDRIGADKLERQIIHNVNEFGWHAVNVIEDDGHPPWSYIIGFHDTWNHPEIIIIGRSRATAHYILETIAAGLGDNRRLDLTATTDLLLPGAACHFVEVAERYYPDYVGFARWYYRRRHFSLVQIVWPNNDGRYPWNADAARSFKEWQPVLGLVPPAW